LCQFEACSVTSYSGCVRAQRRFRRTVYYALPRPGACRLPLAPSRRALRCFTHLWSVAGRLFARAVVLV
jgi:hypothetical protein